MKQRTTKIIALVAMAVLAVSTAFAQGNWREGGSNLNITNPGMVKPDATKGAEWEIITFNDVDYSYFKGSERIDTIRSSKRSMLGFHWKGNELSKVLNDTIYLCNVATGEYMQVGEYWGETGMINHVGLPYMLKHGYSQRAKQQHVFPNWPETEGYFLQILDQRENRVVGRMNRNDGKPGHFEYNKFLAMRNMDEYDDGYVFYPETGEFHNQYKPAGGTGLTADDEITVNPGGFLFQFHPVPGSDGELEYVIYTHRKTDILQNEGGRYDIFKNANEAQYRKRSEYFDRDSYLLLTNAGPMTADYNSVRFVKFAGDMGDPTPKTATLSEGSHNVWTYVNYQGSQATGGLYSSYITNSASEMAGLTVKAATSILGAAEVQGANYGFAQKFVPGNNDAHTITLTAPVGYVITGYSIQAITHTNDRPFTVTPQDGTAVTVGAPNRTPINVTGLDSETTTFTIQSSGETGDAILYFPVFNITVKQQQLGDEIGKSGVIDLTDGLATAAADPNNRWKLVTKTERDRQRLVASEDQPIDVTSRIKNPKFYTSFKYNWKKNDCTGDDTNGYTHANDKTEYKWQWYDRDLYPHTSTDHHVHPYDMADYYNGLDTLRKEHHKIGTGHFWRTGDKNVGNYDQEFMLTEGQEANYSASIYKGSANVQQTITDLREGLYVVYVRGFYAPHDMTKYTIEDWNEMSKNKMGTTLTSGTAPDDWAAQAYYEDTNDGNKKKWHRSHDSYLFAWSYPKGKKDKNGDDLPPEEVRRMLPSIYEGAIRKNQLERISRNSYFESEAFEYTQMGHKYKNQVDVNEQPASASLKTEISNKMALMFDQNVFAGYSGTWFGTGTNDMNWIVPKTVTGAARFFNAVDEKGESDNTHKNASKYRIGLPVYVGSDGELTIGVEHYQAAGLSNSDEWVCFDDFELLYMGKVEPDEFVIDELNGNKNIGGFDRINGLEGVAYTSTEDIPEEDRESDDQYFEESNRLKSKQVKMQNNTQWIDLFSPDDIAHGVDVTTVKKVVLRRTMPKDAFSYVVLPVSLTLKHVKEMFGDEVFVSKLDRFSGNTIYYKNQLTNKTDNQIVMQAGVPYIVKPSKHPEISVGSDLKYKRPAFSKAYSTSFRGVAGMYLRDVKRNYEVEREIEGPIWIATDVTITSSESFPEVVEGQTDNTKGDVWTHITGYGADQSTTPTYIIEGKEHLGTFKMQEFGVYENGQMIPANSYYWANGKMYFTSTEIGPCPRGLYAYMQMIYQDGPNNGKAYAAKFIGGKDNFIEVVDQPTGITDINQPLPDGKMEIYDLQGRKVTNPGRGIYIVNGVKTVFN